MSKMFLAQLQKHHDKLGGMLGGKEADEATVEEIATIKKVVREVPEESPLHTMMVKRLAKLEKPSDKIDANKVKAIHAQTGKLLGMIQDDPMYNKERKKRTKRTKKTA